MNDTAGAYLKTRARVRDLLIDAGPAQLGRTVPACPDWSVRELAAHVVSMPVELAAGRFPGGDIGGWIETIIADRSGDAITELLAEWSVADAALPALVNGSAGLLFDDLAVHEHDLRAALGKPDHRALEVEQALPSALAAFAGRLEQSALGAIAVAWGAEVWRSHEAPAGWTLLAEPWEALRALASRRTADELLALPARGDASPYVAILDAHLPLPARSLNES